MLLIGNCNPNRGGGDPATRPEFVKDVKNDVKCTVLMEESELSLDHVRTLMMQGKILELTCIERTDADVDINFKQIC